MTIIRVHKTKNFSTIANAPVNDPELSWDAKGVLWYLLTKPDGWEVKNFDLEAAGPDGRHKVARAVNELIAAGYMVRRKYQNDKGHWVWVTEVHEDRIASNLKPAVGKPAVGKPAVGKPANIVKTDSIKTDSVKTDEESLPEKSLMIEFTPKVQSLLRCNPKESGVAILPTQIKTVSALSQWLIVEVKATLEQVKAAITYFAWMKNAPTIKQIQEGWAAICTKLKETNQHNNYKRSSPTASKIAPGQTEIWSNLF